jgi:hypothetical protein
MHNLEEITKNDIDDVYDMNPVEVQAVVLARLKSINEKLTILLEKMNKEWGDKHE